MASKNDMRACVSTFVIWVTRKLPYAKAIFTENISLKMLVKRWKRVLKPAVFRIGNCFISFKSGNWAFRASKWINVFDCLFTEEKFGDSLSTFATIDRRSINGSSKCSLIIFLVFFIKTFFLRHLEGRYWTSFYLNAYKISIILKFQTRNPEILT